MHHCVASWSDERNLLQDEIELLPSAFCLLPSCDYSQGTSSFSILPEKERLQFTILLHVFINLYLTREKITKCRSVASCVLSNFLRNISATSLTADVYHYDVIDRLSVKNYIYIFSLKFSYVYAYVYLTLHARYLNSDK